MNDLTITNAQLPTNFEDVSAFAILAQEKLKSVRAEISAIKRLGLAEEVLKQKTKEAQELAEVKLRAEVRLGELTKAMPKKQGARTDLTSSPTVTKLETKEDALNRANIPKQRASQYEVMANNPDIVEKAIAEAKETDDIVSRSLVLNMVKEKKREELRKQRDEHIAEQIEKPKSSNYVDIYTTDKKYRVIYADPPWSYNDKQNVEVLGGAEKHYTTMPLNEICELPVPTADSAVLFIWVTSPLLEDVFKVIKAWGFKYKSSFVWDKVSHNMGHYNSVRHEFLLIATKGSCTPDVKKLYDSVVSIERTEHSRKPKEFRDMIDTLYPVGNRLEMFAREAPDGWDVWGNMV